MKLKVKNTLAVDNRFCLFYVHSLKVYLFYSFFEVSILCEAASFPKFIIK